MECGDVIFVIKEDFLGEGIEFFDNGDFSHVCIAVSDTHVLETDLFTNARIVPFVHKNYEIVKLNLSQEQIDKIPQIAESLIGTKYDYLLIAFYLLKGTFHLQKPWKLPRHEICSELVDHVLYKIGAISEEEFLSGESPNIMYKKLRFLAVKQLIKS